jgi:hypothetical protein
MPLFGIRVLAGEESPGGAAAAAFQRGAGQAFGMAAQAEELRQARSKTEADVRLKNLTSDAQAIKNKTAEELGQLTLESQRLDLQTQEAMLPGLLVGQEQQIRAAEQALQLGDMDLYERIMTQPQRLEEARLRVEGAQLDLEDARTRSRMTDEQFSRFMAGRDVFEEGLELTSEEIAKKRVDLRREEELAESGQRAALLGIEVAEFETLDRLAAFKAESGFYATDAADELIEGLPPSVRGAIKKMRSDLPENPTPSQLAEFDARVDKLLQERRDNRVFEYQDQVEDLLLDLQVFGNTVDGTIIPESDFNDATETRIREMTAAGKHAEAYRAATTYVGGIRLKQQKRMKRNQTGARAQLALQKAIENDEGEDLEDAAQKIEKFLSDDRIAGTGYSVNYADGWLRQLEVDHDLGSGRDWGSFLEGQGLRMIGGQLVPDTSGRAMAPATGIGTGDGTPLTPLPGQN